MEPEEKGKKIAIFTGMRRSDAIHVSTVNKRLLGLFTGEKFAQRSKQVYSRHE